MIKIDTSDLKDITVPDFKSDLDEFTLSAFKTDADRILAKSISQLRAEAKWASETACQSYNRAMANARFIRTYGPFIAIVSALVGIAASAFISSLIK